jgi:FkbM family methyltransferase
MQRPTGHSLTDNLQRVAILLRESTYSDWPVLLWSLRPAVRRRGGHFLKFLELRGLVKNYSREHRLAFAGYNFYYAGDDLAALTADLVSIWGNDNDYFARTFISSGVYFFEGPYENQAVKIQSGDCVIDAGANLGLFTVLASGKIGASGRLYAFEPVTRTRRLLEQNIQANGLTNVQVEPLALGRQTGPVTFNIPADLGSSSAVFSAGELHSLDSEIVPMETLDNLVAAGEIFRVDFIKADIEGGERDLLRGAAETIKKFHPRLALCTYHRSDDRTVLTDLLLAIEPRYQLSFSPTKMFAYYDDRQ